MDTRTEGHLERRSDGAKCRRALRDHIWRVRLTDLSIRQDATTSTTVIATGLGPERALWTPGRLACSASIADEARSGVHMARLGAPAGGSAWSE